VLYRNYILDVLKKQQKEMSVRQEYGRSAVLPYIIADEIIYHRETQQVIAKAVNQLPQQQQLVYRMSRECGWKRDRIAKELKISPNTVKAHMQKGLRFLKERVDEKN
jgi:RNA polymerase sigma-70 factor (ECF subfamily)